MIKRPIHQENKAIVDVYRSKNQVFKFMKKNQTELKGETDNTTIIARDSNTLLSILDETTRSNINKDTEDSNTTVQVDLTFQPMTVRINTLQTHKTNLINLKGLKLYKACPPSMLELSQKSTTNTNLGYPQTQAYLRDITGSVSEHCNKVPVTIKQVT